MKKMLGALKNEENYPAGVNLRPGDYVVKTAFSIVKINVKYVPSIIKDGGPTAMKFFRKQIDASLQRIDSNNLGQCTQLATGLLALGFSKQDDIPYALAYKGIRSGLTADQLVNALVTTTPLRLPPFRADSGSTPARRGRYLRSIMQRSIIRQLRTSLSAWFRRDADEGIYR